uniref:LAGLIDADG_2 domain-containing protein n=1 Tax=Panagrellus redivivus TaxID=6233 RepID=A0A7E4V0V7_PANRE
MRFIQIMNVLEARGWAVDVSYRKQRINMTSPQVQMAFVYDKKLKMPEVWRLLASFIYKSADKIYTSALASFSPSHCNIIAFLVPFSTDSDHRRLCFVDYTNCTPTVITSSIMQRCFHYFATLYRWI